jgi:hypothetical protein
MNRRLTALATAVAATAATAALVPATGASAAGSAQRDLDVTGAYLYLDHDSASKRDFVRVVFETADPFARRADGAIRGGVSIDGFSHSIATVRHGASVYTGAAPVKDHSITSLQAGEGVRRGARVGATFTVRFFDGDGHRAVRRMTLRAERAGDDAGRPLAG